MADWWLAFSGIIDEGVDLAADLEALHEDRTLYVISIAALKDVALRLQELEEIVSQNALTAADLPHQGWAPGA